MKSGGFTPGRRGRFSPVALASAEKIANFRDQKFLIKSFLGKPLAFRAIRDNKDITGKLFTDTK